jgi:hypothetical protein
VTDYNQHFTYTGYSKFLNSKLHNVCSNAHLEKVIVFCLPPNSSHRTQPLDEGP